MTDDAGDPTDYVYNNLNQLTDMTDFQAGAYRWEYDDLGNRWRLFRPNTTVVNYLHRQYGEVTWVQHFLTGTGFIDGTAGFNRNNLRHATAKTNMRTGVVYGYSYDKNQQVTQTTEDTVVTETFTYDKVGNRLSAAGASPYVYNVSNQLTSTPTATYTYDANGNTDTKMDGSGSTLYNWDYQNRLESVNLPAGSTVSFDYDPFGRRIRKVSPTSTTIYVYDGEDIIEEVDAAGVTQARYVHGPGIDEPLAMVRGGASYYYNADHIGSIISLTGAAGTIVQSYVYDSFGNVVSSTGTVENPYQYSAREFDSETGLYYYRARYYDPEIGRFLSEDPAGFFDGANMYLYTANSPIDYVDPFGLYRLIGFPASLAAEMTVAIENVKQRLSSSCCAPKNKMKLLNLLESASWEYKPSFGRPGRRLLWQRPQLCGRVLPIGFLRKRIGIGPDSFAEFGGECGPLECIVIHELGHLKWSWKIKDEGFSERLAERCFGCPR